MNESRVLDLGCGRGRTAAHLGVSSSDQIVGADRSPVFAAAKNFPTRDFVQARGEALPFADGSFNRVICQLALPYMNIPQALREINRVLADGGTLYATLHPFRFTWYELMHCALPNPIPTFYRLWVMFNGGAFHFTGRLLKFRGRFESFQTERAIIRALKETGLVLVSLGRRVRTFEVSVGRVRSFEAIEVTAQKPRSEPSPASLPPRRLHPNT